MAAKAKNDKGKGKKRSSQHESDGSERTPQRRKSDHASRHLPDEPLGPANDRHLELFNLNDKLFDDSQAIDGLNPIVHYLLQFRVDLNDEGDPKWKARKEYYKSTLVHEITKYRSLQLASALGAQITERPASGGGPYVEKSQLGRIHHSHEDEIALIKQLLDKLPPLVKAKEAATLQYRRKSGLTKDEFDSIPSFFAIDPDEDDKNPNTPARDPRIAKWFLVYIFLVARPLLHQQLRTYVSVANKTQWERLVNRFGDFVGLYNFIKEKHFPRVPGDLVHEVNELDALYEMAKEVLELDKSRNESNNPDQKIRRQSIRDILARCSKTLATLPNATDTLADAAAALKD